MHTMMIDSSFQTKVVAAYIPFGVEPPEASIKYEMLKRRCTKWRITRNERSQCCTNSRIRFGVLFAMQPNGAMCWINLGIALKPNLSGTKKKGMRNSWSPSRVRIMFRSTSLSSTESMAELRRVEVDDAWLKENSVTLQNRNAKTVMAMALYTKRGM